MIKSGKHNVTAVLLSMMLFFTFAMMHEFDWLLPPSPDAATAMSVNHTSDAAEEVGCEDEIEHSDSYIIISSFNDERDSVLLPVSSLFIAGVLTPPPDVA